MSAPVVLPTPLALPPGYGVPVAYPAAPVAVPQVAHAGLHGAPVMTGETWTPTLPYAYPTPQPVPLTVYAPQPIAPVLPYPGLVPVGTFPTPGAVTASAPQALGLLALIGQLLDRAGSAAQQGLGLLDRFRESVAGFLAPAPSVPTAPSSPPSSAPPSSGPKTPPASSPTRFVLSSFNILSSSAGNGKGYAPGTERIDEVVQILKNNAVSIVGFQEMDQKQHAEFKKQAGDTYGTFVGASGVRGYHDTVIAWRKDQWKLLKGDTITVPSYGGRESKVPYVLLRNKQTGQEAYVINAHNPANTKRYHHQERYRDAAARQEADLAKRLFEKTGLPVFVVGDMNSVSEAREIFTKQAPLKAANPPGKAGIDWIFGSKGVTFDEFRRVRTDLIKKTTDHPVVFTEVTIGGK